MYFEKQKGEEIVEMVRRSFFTILPPFLEALFLSFPGIYGLLYLDQPMISLISLVWLIFLISYVFYHWLIWHYDVYVITNQRVININQKSLFTKEVLELSYDKIEDVYYGIESFSGSLFGYGTVKILPRSNISYLKMDIVNVSDPQDIQKLILGLRARSESQRKK